ncbi:hypothetical protein MHK_010355 [Candidatus Magnetomorum sp. HK-1]|nr:hypothetical protein MHK_010355 [Candidatus Magnetomorum sp. HK-1]
MNTYSNNIINDEGANAGNLIIKANKDIIFEDGASIWSLTFGKGNTGNITITGKNMWFGGSNNDQYLDSFYRKFFFLDGKRLFESNNGVIASIVTPLSNGGNGGNITIKGNNIFLNDAYFLTNATLGPGNTGNIDITAKGLLALSDAIGPDIWVSAIYTSSMPIGNVIGGNAGNININASNLHIESGACVASATLSQYCTKNSGNAGNITIIISENIKITGVNEFGSSYQFQGGHIYGSNIGATSRGFIYEDSNQLEKIIKAGDPGKISIITNSLSISDGAQIIAFNFGEKKWIE